MTKKELIKSMEARENLLLTKAIRNEDNPELYIAFMQRSLECRYFLNMLNELEGGN